MSLPTEIDRYQIRERLGQGGMGTLFLALDPAIDRLVALKVLRVDNPDIRERFEREARLAARLQHPNIVTIYDVGEHEGQPFIAMEYIPGDTFQDIIRRRDPLDLRRKVEMMIDVCAGLAYAHKHGIVHRDVKPANLIVSRDSQIVKILDFGIARAGESGLTQVGMVIGTPNYMSPEQVRGELVDHRSDIFAVGLVLYELLVYRRAFEADSQTAVLMKILTESPPTLLSLDPLLDPAIAELVERALAKDPAKRPPDLASLRTELTRLLYRLESMGPDDRTIIVPRPSQKGGGPATPPPLPDAASLLRDARSRLEAGALTEASALVARAAELDPSSGDVGPMRLAIEQAAAERERLRERARRVSAALKQAREALDAGALDSATRAVSEALSLNPDDRGALALRSEIQQRSARAAQPPPPIPPSAVTPPPPPPPTPIPAAIEPAARQLEAPARIGPTRRVPLAFLAAAAVALLMVVIVGVLAWRQFSAWQARRATLPPVATKPAATAPSPVAEPPKVVTPAPATPPAGETAAPDPNALISARLAEAVRLFDENTTGAALDDLGELLEEAPQREDLRETALRWARVLQLRAQQARASVARPTRGTWPPAMRNANQTLRRGELQLQNGEGLAAARTLERARTEWQRIGDQAAARSAAREASPGTRRVESAPSPGPPRSEPTPAEPAPAVEPAAPAAREPARQPAGEEDPVHAAINRTLASFERAFESRSAESLRPIWPSLSSGAVQAYQAQFSRVLFQQWTFNSREIRVGPNGNRATAQCSVTVSFLEPGSRDTRVEQRTVRFELERLGPIWVIASVSGV